jgi:hypothetical protein
MVMLLDGRMIKCVEIGGGCCANCIHKAWRAVYCGRPRVDLGGQFHVASHQNRRYKLYLRLVCSQLVLEDRLSASSPIQHLVGNRKL